MHEIERKFLAAYGPELLACGGELEKDLEVYQGYIIAGGKMEWRVRQTNYRTPNKGVRWHTAFKFGNGFVRREYEWEVSAWLGRLLGKLVPKWLHKTRYSKGGWEVDIFHADLQGLVLAEYEVESEDAPVPALPVGVTLLRDVTDEGTFANKRLSRLSAEEAANLVAWNFPAQGADGLLPYTRGFVYAPYNPFEKVA